MTEQLSRQDIPVTDEQPTMGKGTLSKRITYILMSFLVAVAAILAYLYVHTRSQLQTSTVSLSATKKSLANEQSQVRDIAFGVSPDQTFLNVRNKAYHQLATQAYPRVDLDIRQIQLLRVANASAFRTQGGFLSNTQNDDVVVYYLKQAYQGESPAVVVRPRQQRVVAKGTLTEQQASSLDFNNVTYPSKTITNEGTLAPR